jgi:putative glutamine amidotransferase
VAKGAWLLGVRRGCYDQIEMTPEPGTKPRIGVPYRTKKEQLAGDSAKIGRYLKAVERAGGEPIAIALDLAADELRELTRALDGVALSGSPADVDPALFHAASHAKTAAADQDRERTDFTLLENCFASQKPVLAICYGIQSLNVFLGGTLVQDIPSEIGASVEHDVESDHGPETFHAVQLESGSRLSELANGAGQARVNSSHHQSVLAAGRGLRVTARAADGVVEALEGTPDNHWVTAVQWHPERMVDDDALALALFQNLVAAARKVAVRA